MSEFKVNEFITLKLEDGKTNIYIKGEPFRQCKYILTRKKIYELRELNKINSIDEFAEKLDHSLEGVEPESIDIPEETIFWAHSSNMQIWAENDYDTCLLHSNLSFPLLKKLWQLEDPIAQKVFLKEILKRFKEGSLNTILFLVAEGYHNFLDEKTLLGIHLQNNKTLEHNIKKQLNDVFEEKKAVLFILQELAYLKDFRAIKLLKETIMDTLEKEDIKTIEFLCKWRFFYNNLFTIEELIILINNSDLPMNKKIKMGDLDLTYLIENIDKEADIKEVIERIICLINKEKNVSRIKSKLLKIETEFILRNN